MVLLLLLPFKALADLFVLCLSEFKAFAEFNKLFKFLLFLVVCVVVAAAGGKNIVRFVIAWSWLLPSLERFEPSPTDEEGRIVNCWGEEEEEVSSLLLSFPLSLLVSFMLSRPLPSSLSLVSHD